MSDQSVLTEAHDLVHGDRQRDYDHPTVDYGRATAIFNAWTGHELTTAEGVKFAIAIKMSRQVTSPHLRDHYVDAAGYWGCLAKVEGHDA